MARSTQDAFLNAYLRNYKKMQDDTVRRGKNSVHGEMVMGTGRMNAGRVNLPTDDATPVFLNALANEAERQQKAAQAAAAKAAKDSAKAAAKAAKEAEKAKKEEEKKKAKEEAEMSVEDKIKAKHKAEFDKFINSKSGNVPLEDFGKGSSLGGKIGDKSKLSKREVEGVRRNVNYKVVNDWLENNPDMAEIWRTGNDKKREEMLAALPDEKREKFERMKELYDSYGGMWSKRHRFLKSTSGLGEKIIGSIPMLASTAAARLKDLPDDLKNADYRKERLESLMPWQTAADSAMAMVHAPDLYNLIKAKKAFDKALEKEEDVTAVSKNTPVDMDSFGARHIRQGYELSDEAKSGLSDAGKFAFGLGESAAQNLAMLPTAFINPAIPLAGMGTLAASDRAYELGERGLPAKEVLARSAATGLIEAGTEKLGLDSLMDIALSGSKVAAKQGVKSALAQYAKKTGVDLLKNMSAEGAEEAISYIANYAVDKAAKDPTASFDWNELLLNAAGGAIVGGALGGGASIMNNAIDYRNQNTNAPVNENIPQLEVENQPISENVETLVDSQPAQVTDSEVSEPAANEALPMLEPTAAEVLKQHYLNGELTNSEIETLKPGGENRAEFENIIGIELPETSSETRKALKQMSLNPLENTVDTNNATVYNEGEQEVPTNGRTGNDGVSEVSGNIGRLGQGMGIGDGGRREKSGAHPVFHRNVTENKAVRDAVAKFGSTPIQLNETTEMRQEFSDALNDAIKSNKFGLMVSPKSVEELQQPGTRTFMTDDRKAGMLVTADGDIEGVFKTKGGPARKAVAPLMLEAISQGGKKLDCYGIDLVNKYARFGFEPVARVDFNEEYAPKGWNYGELDVYAMKLKDGLDAEKVAEKINLSEEDGGFRRYTQEELDSLRHFGKKEYEDAMAYRNQLMNESSVGNQAAFSNAHDEFGNAIPALMDTPNTVGSKEAKFTYREAPSQHHTVRDIDDATLTDEDFEVLEPFNPVHQVVTHAERKARTQQIYEADRASGLDPLKTEMDALIEKSKRGEVFNADEVALSGDIISQLNDKLASIADKKSDAYKEAAAQKKYFTNIAQSALGETASALNATQMYTSPERAAVASSKVLSDGIKKVEKKKGAEFKKASDEIKSAVDKAKASVDDELSKSSEKLAKRIANYAKDSKDPKVQDEVETLIRQTFGSAIESPVEEGIKVKNKQTPIDKLNIVLNNQQAIRNMWDGSKSVLKEKYANDEDMYNRLENYFENNPDGAIFSNRLMGDAISYAIKQRKIDMRKVSRKSEKGRTEIYKQITDDVLAGSNVPAEFKAQFAERFDKAYNSIVADAVEKNLKQMFPDKPKAKNEPRDQFLDLLRMGVYTDATVKELAATKFGINPLTNEQAERITSIMERVEELPLESKERVELENEAAAIAASQINSDFLDKWDAWRHTSMLGNLRTIVGSNDLNNIAQGLLARAKDLGLAAVEGTLDAVSNGKIDRTTSFVNMASPKGRALLSAAAADMEQNAYRSLTSTSEKLNIVRDAPKQKRIYKHEIPEKLRLSVMNSMGEADVYGVPGTLEGLRGWNKSLDKVADAAKGFDKKLTDKGIIGVAGLRNNYAWALAQFLKANGKDSSIFTSQNPADIELLQKGREVAIRRAQENTFHETSAVGKFISRAKNDLKNSDDPNLNSLYKVSEGIMPYVATPINVGKQVFRYSPVGLLVNSGRLAGAAVKKNDISVPLERFAQGVTGSTLAAIGAGLFLKGLLTPSVDDDDKTKSQMTGEEAFTLHLLGEDGRVHGYSVNWLSGVAVPMFIGAEIANVLVNGSGDGESKLNDITNASLQIFAPLLDTGMLQGFNNALGAVRRSRDNNQPILDVLANSAASYYTQGLPTLGGQLARTIDPVRRSTYSGATGLEGNIKYQINKAKNKIPFLSKTSEPFIDYWGEEEVQDGSLPARAFENFLIPGYTNEGGDEVDQQLVALSESKDDRSNVLPSLAPTYIGSRSTGTYHRFSPEEYTDYARQRGQLSRELVEMTLDSIADENLQAEIIPDLYSIAGTIAAHDVVNYPIPDTKAKPIDVYNQFGSDALIDWLYYKSIADINGNDIISQDEARATLNQMSIPELQKDYFYSKTNTGWKAGR